MVLERGLLSFLVWGVIASQLGAGVQLRSGPQLWTSISNPGVLRGQKDTSWRLL